MAGLLETIKIQACFKKKKKGKYSGLLPESSFIKMPLVNHWKCLDGDTKFWFIWVH